jgi:hypothetical protein
LNKYLSKRPAKEDLKRSGILNEVVFGGSIEEQIASESATRPAEVLSGVPQVVRKCVEYVEAHLLEVGIYRLSGNASHIQKLATKCNEDVFTADIAGERDFNVIAGLLKLYFRELAEPLFMDELYEGFIEAAKIPERSERLTALKVLLQAIPSGHLSTLNYLCEHLLRVAEQSASNKMAVNNVAIVFGPTLVRKNAPTMDNIIKDTPFQSGIVEEILTQLAWFMDGVPA